MAEKKIKGKVPAAVKEFYDTVPPNRDPRMTGAKYRKYLRGLKAVGKFPGIRTAGALKMSMQDALDDAKKRSGKSTFIQRRITLGGVGSQAAKAAKATKVGKIAAGVAAAALATKAGLEKLYEKRTGKKPFTKRKKQRTLVDKKMGGGMMKKVPGLKKGSLNQGTFSIGPFKPKPGGSKPSLDDYDQMKKMRKKMGGGLTEATRRLRAQGLKTGGSACRGMGAAIRGGDFKGVK
jgi:hypothetical protein